MFKASILTLSLFIYAFTLSAQSAYPSDSEISIVVEKHNFSGGGFQSDVTITDDGMTVYSSADVSGIFKSTDGGLSYKNINEGLKSPKVASLAITPDNDQILYAGTGDKGGSGGLFRSIDGGENWTLTGDGNEAQFAGNHSLKSHPIPDGHPRSNGDLIIVKAGANPSTYTDDIVIAGTYKDGVKIFTQGGESEHAALNPDGFVRSVAFHPDVPNLAYAAIQFGESASEDSGIYEINFGNLNSISSTNVYPTALPEGLTVLSNGHVYAAIGENGIAKFNGTSWFLRNADLSIGNVNRQWTAVTGYVSGSNDVVYIGTINLGGNANGSNYSNIWRSENGGNSWTELVSTNNVYDQIHGQSYDWWFRIDAFPQAGLGRTNSVVSSIDVALGANATSTHDDIIYISGRGGIWKSANGGTSWNPAVYNMQATANNGVAVNPRDSEQVVVANTDFVLIESKNTFEDDDVRRDKPSGAESRGYDVEFDTIAKQVILGVGDRDTNFPGGGEVYIKEDAAIGTNVNWTNTNLQGKTTANNGRVRAICHGYHNGGMQTSQTILAAVEGEGVFRYKNGVWTKSTGITIGNTKRSNFVWPDNQNRGAVYLLDLSTGLHRSFNGGQSWTNIWDSMHFNNNDFYNTGYITADDNDPSTLYISIQGGSGSPIGTSFKVYRMTGANSGTFGPPGSSDIQDITKHSGNIPIQRPGPIVFGQDGRLWLTQQQNSPNNIDAGLFVMDDPQNDASFKNVTTNEYRNLAVQPSGIDASSDGHVYISQNGTGLVKVKYSDRANIVTDDDCITVYADPSNSIYTLNGDFSDYNIELVRPGGFVYANLNDRISDDGTSVSVNINELPVGSFLIRVIDPSNNKMLVEKIIK